VFGVSATAASSETRTETVLEPAAGTAALPPPVWNTLYERMLSFKQDISLGGLSPHQAGKIF
jgi:hypothetical protein